MSKEFFAFQTLFKKNNIRLLDKRFEKILYEYDFLFVSCELEILQYPKLIAKFNESKMLIINDYQEKNEGNDIFYFIVSFEQTIIIIEKKNLYFIHTLFSSKKDLKIIFLTNKKEIFGQTFHFQYQEISFNDNFKDEITSFNEYLNFNKKEMSSFVNLWRSIKSCISGYLIKKSYQKLTKNRINSYHEIKRKDIKESEFIRLRKIEMGSSSTIILIYYIEKNELLALKIPNDYDDIETPKLLNREFSNYLKLHHPLLLQFYGKVENRNHLIIEFIDGETLLNIKKLDLNIMDKCLIFFELLLVFEYLHSQKCVYRDLKPNNVMIDRNNKIVLIDYDRLIDNDIIFNRTNPTLDFASQFTAPEVNTGKYSYSCDIYSLGKMMLFIFFDGDTQTFMNSHNLGLYEEIFKIYKKCTDDPEKRLNISQLIFYFYYFYHSLIDDQDLNTIINSKQEDINLNIPYLNFVIGMSFFEGQNVKKDIHLGIKYLKNAAAQNNPNAQNLLGYIYYFGRNVSPDINQAIRFLTLAANQNIPQANDLLGVIYLESDANKAIYYFTLAANQNYIKSLISLARIYMEGKYIKPDISKAINYIKIAADLKSSLAQYYLGQIYYEGKFVKRNLNKSINYFQSAADQNFGLAQFELGVIYYEGQHVSRDINKAIHYYTLASNNNIIRAQFNLGLIYYEEKYIIRDINKAYNYFLLAANQNDPNAQFFLGKIYQYEKYDYNNAVYFYTLAANQNNKNAQYSLGLIYYDGKYIEQDINKAIHYFLQASNQNDHYSQFYLGTIYFHGMYIERNIEKGIYYYTLAADQNDVQSQHNLGILYYEGKYIKRDINKSIHYFSLAANQNLVESQYNLGIIYYEGKYIERDINKSFYYFSIAAKNNHPYALLNLGIYYGEHQNLYYEFKYYKLAADQNLSQAQYNLGCMYYNGNYVKKDINTAIHYFTLAANQNLSQAQYKLGCIYYTGYYVKKDINKAIHYFTLAANQNLSKAQEILGYINFNGKHVRFNINKAIHYFTLASNNNSKNAQFILGILYMMRKQSNESIKKGFYYIMLASKNGNRYANFVHGFLLHEGKIIKNDIDEAIHYYKEAISFKIQYAKNNIGIIYKNGYDKIKRNIYAAQEYFGEAIREKNDYLSMYNLAHIFLYDEQYQNIDKSIELLCKSSKQFFHSLILLGIALVKKYGNDSEAIQFKIKELIGKSNDLSPKIFYIIKYLELFNYLFFECLYELYKKMDFLYDLFFQPVLSSEINKKKIIEKNPNLKNISDEFYNGFGYDLL